MKLNATCAICAKPLQLTSESRCADGYFRTYKCGHAFYETTALPGDSRNSLLNFHSIHGNKEAFDFQKDGIQFIIDTNFNCLIADPMGLGKTIQVLLAAREAKLSDGSPRFKRILAIVKSATTYQWFGETKEWYNAGLWSTFLIQGSKSMIVPGFDVYIISMDTLSRFMNNPKGSAALKALGIDLVIVDECHSFKNPDSARSQALVAFLQNISFTEITRPLRLNCIMCQESWSETAKIKINCRGNTSEISHRHATQCPKCGARKVEYTDRIVLDERERTKGLVLLSGTPIKNRAEEYFIPLNLMRPDLFTSLKYFRQRWLTQDVNGKWNRIAPWRLEEFREVTKSFILRREKNEVLSLPAFRRTFCKVSLEDEKWKAAYNQAVAELQSKVDELAAEGKELTYFEVEANLMRMRRILALGKLPFAVDYVNEFLESTENEKILVGVHHEAVRDNLYFALKQAGHRVLKLSGEDSADRKNQLVEQFNTDPEIRVMVVNMIAGGVGLNLQVANNELIIERQWNAADEEQFEGRCHRYGQNLPVQADYMIAEGFPTEDYFTAMVEEKRQTCGETLDGWDFRQDAGAVRELVARTLQHRAA